MKIFQGYFFLSFLVLVSCTGGEEKTQETLSVALVSEVYQTERDTLNNVDTPAIWHNPNGEVWLLATAKETDRVLVYDASSGKRLHIFSEEGSDPGQIDRPNSIAVIDNHAVVIERDNHRVQIFQLPDFSTLGYFGEDVLIKPYGLSVIKNDDSYRLFVTDNYETEEEEVPPLNELNNRVHEFNYRIDDGGLISTHINGFGDTTEVGALRVVESLIADKFYNRLLIADEDSLQNHLKVYDLDGNFTGEIIGEGLFKHETEGIALYECSDNSGYWIATDQSHEENRFHVFDRITLDHLGTFDNPATTNTDGITITQTAFDGFESGAFFPIHNDGNVTAIRWEDIADPLELKTCLF